MQRAGTHDQKSNTHLVRFALNFIYNLRQITQHIPLTNTFLLFVRGEKSYLQYTYSTFRGTSNGRDADGPTLIIIIFAQNMV